MVVVVFLAVCGRGGNGCGGNGRCGTWGHTWGHTGCYDGDGLGGGCCGGTLVVVIEVVGMPIIGIPVNR